MDDAALLALIQATADWAGFVTTGDDQAVADACNALSDSRVPVSEMTRSEFVAQFALLIKQVPAKAPEVQTRWAWYRDMLLSSERLVTAALSQLGILSDMEADLASDALAQAAMGNPTATAADLMAYMGSRPATVAEAAGVFGEYHYVTPDQISYLDIAQAMKPQGVE